MTYILGYRPTGQSSRLLKTWVPSTNYALDECESYGKYKESTQCYKYFTYSKGC